MCSEENSVEADGNCRKWKNLLKILDRSGPFCQPDFEPSPSNLTGLQETVRLLVIGAGGLGCELLKDLALMGFRNIHVIDMDTIELSNLNRQFLFRRKDIGLSKAEVAAKFINERISGANVTPHFSKIQDFDESFYSQFHIVVCGLDSVVARRWINGMLLSMLQYDDNEDLVESSVIPIIDGGTEGFKGNARVIVPGMTACIDCTIDLYPPQVTYPLCTIANTPRLPEHCIEYVKVIQWNKENPWSVAIDGDDPAHVNWIYEKACERSNQFNIPGVTYRLVQGVVKNIIPAVASTNAVIAAACATEAFKFATSCCAPLNNYMVFNDVDGIYTFTYEAERNPSCLACSQTTKVITLSGPKNLKLQDLIQLLCDKPEYQMKNPGITALIGGKNKTLYLPLVKSIEEATRPNLTKTLADLNLEEGVEVLVADVTSPNTLIFKLHYESTNNDVDMN